MPIQNIQQPNILQVDETVRLRKYDGNHDFALNWYQDEEIVYLVDGVKNKYTLDRLDKMYTYLNNQGELYFIEILENNDYVSIGDVTFWQEDMPIVIGNPKYRKKGIGKKVIQTLIQRGKELGYDKLYINEIYDYNIGSKKCFESLGFQPYEKTEEGQRYVLNLKICDEKK